MILAQAIVYLSVQVQMMVRNNQLHVLQTNIDTLKTSSIKMSIHQFQSIVLFWTSFYPIKLHPFKLLLPYSYLLTIRELTRGRVRSVRTFPRAVMRLDECAVPQYHSSWPLYITLIGMETHEI